MKNVHVALTLLVVSVLSIGVFAQVDIDKPINMSGGSGDRKITNLETPVNPSDAVNKQYVDTQIASVSSGSSNLQLSFTSGTSDIYIAPGVAANPVTLSLTYVSGTPSPVGIVVSGLPSGVTHNLSPGGGFPSFNSTFVLTASLAAALGDYSITLTATGGASPQVLNLNLHILPRKRVFVTATAYNGNLGGLSGADSKCNADASSAGLGGSWKAWLSTSTVHAKDRISDGLYVRVDNSTIIATSKTDLLDGTLQNSISKTAMGVDASDWPMWTGTLSDGTVITNKHCSNWTSNSSGINGRIGDRSVKGIEWTDYYDASGFSGCATVFGRIYCFEE